MSWTLPAHDQTKVSCHEPCNCCTCNTPTVLLRRMLDCTLRDVHHAGVPLLASAFIHDHKNRLISLAVASTFALAAFGAIGAWLGGSDKIRPAVRVLLGGWLAMGITYGFGAAFASIDSS